MYFFCIFHTWTDPRQGRRYPWKEIHIRGIAGACLINSAGSVSMHSQTMSCWRFCCIIPSGEATADQLCEVEGVGPRTAEYLSLISASMRRYQTDRNRARNSVVRLNDPDKIGAFFVPRFAAAV